MSVNQSCLNTLGNPLVAKLGKFAKLMFQKDIKVLGPPDTKTEEKKIYQNVVQAMQNFKGKIELDKKGDTGFIYFNTTNPSKTSETSHQGLGLIAIIFSNWFQLEKYSLKVKVSATEEFEMQFFNNETFMMVMKSIYFEDYDFAEKLMLVGNDPAQVKPLGRKSKWFDNGVCVTDQYDLSNKESLEQYLKLWTEEWNKVHVRVMVAGLVLKFSQLVKFMPKELFEVLHNNVLVQSSKTDKIWGIGMKAQEAFLANQQVSQNWIPLMKDFDEHTVENNEVKGNLLGKSLHYCLHIVNLQLHYFYFEL